MPRSSTNLFAAYLMTNSNVVSYNVGGGRYPFISLKRFDEFELFPSPGLKKVIDSDTCFVRDELKVGFIGERRHYFTQVVFKIYEYLSKSNQKRIILLRNPFAIAASMQSYADKNESHKHIWDFSNQHSLNRFVDQYVSLMRFIKSPRSREGLVVDPWMFFNDKNIRVDLFKKLNLPLYEGSQNLFCKRGHEYSIEDNFYTCSCGVLKGFGGFNPAEEIHPERLLVGEKYIAAGFIFEIQDLLIKYMGNEIASCFSTSGKTDLTRLLMLLDHDIS